MKMLGRVRERERDIKDSFGKKHLKLANIFRTSYFGFYATFR